eukprot:scaffold223757_cov19-Prasinocladus_malaysianus.AAC.1
MVGVTTGIDKGTVIFITIEVMMVTMLMTLVFIPTIIKITMETITTALHDNLTVLVKRKKYKPTQKHN